MNNFCAACQKTSTVSRSIKCTKCNAFYHFACVNISIGGKPKINDKWVCPTCKVSEPKGDNTNTPVRAPTASCAGACDTDLPSPENPLPARACKRPAIRSPALSPESDVNNEQLLQSKYPEQAVAADLLNEIRLMRQDMHSFREDFNALRDGLSAVRSAVEGFGGRMDGMESRLVGLEEKCAQLQAKPDVGDMLQTIEQLKTQINERDQELLHNDIEVTGIPEEQGENTIHLVTIIAKKLGVPCEARDLVFVERAGVRRVPTGSESSAALRPRPIVARVSRRELRDAFLQAARVRRGVTTEGMGLTAASTRFFVNERLSRQNRQLFFKAREAARSFNWKFAWTRDGRIFVRQETGKAAFRVRSELDVKKIFGTE